MKTIGVKNPNKKAIKAKNNVSRVRIDFNTGTRTHKNKKDYDRKKEKLFCKKYLTN
jgi:hypothetical protein